MFEPQTRRKKNFARFLTQTLSHFRANAFVCLQGDVSIVSIADIRQKQLARVGHENYDSAKIT